MLAVIVFQRLYHRAVLFVVVNVAAAARENNIAVHSVLEIDAGNDRLYAYGDDEQQRREPRHRAAADSPYAENGYCEESERAPYDVDIAHPFIVAYLLNECNERNEREYYRQQPAYLKLTQLGERTVGERYEEEYEHERIAVVEPVRVLKAVPYKVGQRERHAHREYGDKARSGELFPSARLTCEEEHRHEQQRQRAAGDERKPLGTNGVVGGGHHLCKEVEQVEFCLKVVARA